MTVHKLLDEVENLINNWDRIKKDRRIINTAFRTSEQVKLIKYY